MKSSIRFFAVLAFFTVAMSLNSFGYSVLCQSLPVSVSAGSQLVTLFTCAIPANAVAKGKSLRMTANLHGNTSAAFTAWVELDSSLVDAIQAPANSEQNWSLIVTNTGGTGTSFGGTNTTNASAFAVGTLNCGCKPAVPWSTGWNLQILVSSNGSTVFGDTFTVEILS